ALVSENRPEWIIADLAISSAGAITVPAYVTNTGNDHRHVLGNAGAHAVIVSTAALAARVLPAAAPVPSVKFAIAMEPFGETAAPFPVHGWEDALNTGSGGLEAIAERVAGLTPDDIACVI